MRSTRPVFHCLYPICGGALFLLFSLPLFAQASPALSQTATFPHLVQFSGVIKNADGNPGMGLVGITFALYRDEEGGAPLWLETQNAQLDAKGRYSVYLGAVKSEGLPSELFTAGEARWLGVRAQGQVEQPRVLLVAVPYALKAGDAETLGGRPASAYALAGTPAVPVGTSARASSATAVSDGGSTVQPATTCASVTSDGTAVVNALAKFTAPCTVEGSAISESSGRVGIGGAGVSGAKLFLTDTQTNFGLKWLQHSVFDTSAMVNGSTNYGLALDADASNMTIPAGVTDNGYRLGVFGRGFANTTGFAGTLAQQFGVNGSAGILAAKSGAKVESAYGGYYQIYNNVPATTITNAYGVFISNAGTAGTITNRYDLYASSANAKNYFAGNVGIGTTAPAAKLEVNGTAKFDGLVSFAGGQTVSGNLNATGVVTGSSYQIGSNLFGFGNFTNQNAFLGFAGNATATGTSATAVGANALSANNTGVNNTAVGANALLNNTAGGGNTANGASALAANTSGSNNTAAGVQALTANTTGANNTASGQGALGSNTTGSNNTAGGGSALLNNTTGSYNTANGVGALFSNTTGLINTAVGYQALYDDNSGGYNTAAGYESLLRNTSGAQNTAVGMAALVWNSTGNNNTGLGWLAGPSSAHPGLTNATAIGAQAEVDQSNALVLGSINGVNSATADTNVGIGTTTPAFKLHVGTGANGLRVEGPATTGAIAASFGGNGQFGIDAPGCAACRFVVKDGGNVGIGNAAPAAKLDVTGNGNITGNLTVGGTLSGTLGAVRVTGTTITIGQGSIGTATATCPSPMQALSGGFIIDGPGKNAAVVQAAGIIASTTLFEVTVANDNGFGGPSITVTPNAICLSITIND